MFKRIAGAFLIVLTGLCIYYWPLLSYAAGQGWGQWRIIRGARPVEEFLKDPSFPDSLKQKLQLIQKARQYAIDSLGLNDTENYSTLYDQKGKELMWVVIACEPFRLQEKRWDFPIIGSVPYKGYFDKEKALKERETLEKGNWDVSIRNPGGWSTLGWFTDPILSGMLRRSDGDLASLIIHEMVHSTIYVRDSSEFNENLASFIGDRAAEKFLATIYGDTARQYNEYLHEDGDYRKVAEHMLRATKKLDSLYGTMKDTDPLEEKKEKKEAMIRRIVEALDTIRFSDGRKPASRFSKRLPNNTYFISFKTYESKHDYMKDEWEGKYKGDLKKMIDDYKMRYPSL